MQPRFAGRIVVSAVDGFIQHVRIVTAQSVDLLVHSRLRVLYQLAISAIPQLIAMGQLALHATARSLQNVFVYELRVQRRELAVPVDALASGVSDRRHDVPPATSRQRITTAQPLPDCARTPRMWLTCLVVRYESARTIRDRSADSCTTR